MRRFGVAPRVKLNPRNLRCDGCATALLTLLILKKTTPRWSDLRRASIAPIRRQNQGIIR